MKIDMPTTSNATIDASFKRNASTAALQTRIGDEWTSLDLAPAHDLNHANSSVVVSISEAAQAAAQASSTSSLPPALSAEGTIDSTGHHESNPQVNLDKLMFDLLTGSKVLGMSAADLAAIRASGANSDLQTKRIEQAAVRAGFTLERRISKDPVTVDETTFQARGVIRTKV